MIQNLPKGARSAAFRTFAAEIRRFPLLADNRVVRSWRLWDGQGPTAPPVVAQMPAAQLRILGGPVRRIAPTGRAGPAATFDVESKIVVAVEIWTAGSDQGDAADLGDLFESAAFPLNPGDRAAMQSRLRAVGVADWHLSASILPPAIEAYDQAWIYASGTFELTLQLRC